MTQCGASYLLAPGTVTHSRGGTLDLVITGPGISQQVLECYVDPNLDAISNHKVIITTIETGDTVTGTQQMGKFQLDKMDEKKFLSMLETQKDLIKIHLHKAQDKEQSRDQKKNAVERCAKEDITVIHASLEASTLRAKNFGRGELWWNESCKQAVSSLKKLQARYLLDRRAGIVQEPGMVERAKGQLRKVVKKAKQSYYQQVIDNLDSKTIFGAVKWSTSTKQYTTPAIRRLDGSLAISNFDKQHTLKTALFTPPNTLDQGSPVVTPELYIETRERPFAWDPCIIEEVQDAVDSAGNILQPGQMNSPH